MASAKDVWGYIENRDHRVMRRMNRWKAPRWIRYWMLAATRMGDGWLWYSLGAMLLLSRRASPLCRSGSGGLRGHRRSARLQGAEEDQPPPAAM